MEVKAPGEAGVGPVTWRKRRSAAGAPKTTMCPPDGGQRLKTPPIRDTGGAARFGSPSHENDNGAADRWGQSGILRPLASPPPPRRSYGEPRSEERRVGKECRSRWSP